MSFQDTLRKSLTPELFTQVIDQLGDDFDFDLVPRSRLNKVIKQRNDFRDQLAEISQSQGNRSKGNNEDDDEGGSGGEDIETIRQQIEAQKNEAIQAVKIQYAALEKLRESRAIDPELLWSSNIFDKSKIKLDEAGKLTGLDEMIAQLKKDKAHLFNKDKKDVPDGTGKDGDDDSGSSVTTKEEFLKLGIDEQIAFKKANPEVFKTFMS